MLEVGGRGYPVTPQEFPHLRPSVCNVTIDFAEGQMPDMPPFKPTLNVIQSFKQSFFMGRLVGVQNVAKVMMREMFSTGASG